MAVGTFVTNVITTALNFVVDLHSLVQDTGKQIDWAVVSDAYKRGAFIVKLAGAVAVDDTQKAVDALAYPLKKGDILDFGPKKFLQLTQDEPAGAVLIHFEAAATAIADDSEAIGQYDFGPEVNVNHRQHFIPAGTVMSELSNRKLVPRAIRPGSEAATCVLLTDAKTFSKTDSKTGYGVTYGGVLYENRMPDADKSTGLLPSAYKTELSTRFVWRRSHDSRGVA